ncbi:TPA: hypothetical protein H1016_03260 [archaeon]|uniref:Gingipain domain-containing protein n=1 Tax=Candidatus Naiadarchaeum limnaeum TaxID=2756139 RepID=A0A832XJF6_9ARCH|nr:hypothetical protein [Candidatus Naiadarchaeum limnaeum]
MNKGALVLIGIVIVVVIGIAVFSLTKVQKNQPEGKPEPQPAVTESKSVTQKGVSTSDVFYSDLPVIAPKKIVLVVDATTYQMLKSEIDRFANDISVDLKNSVKILDKNYGSPSEVKTSLTQEKNNNGDFAGIIFIGDIPWQYLSTKGVLQSPAASDSWYLDLEDKNLYTEKINTECKDPNLMDQEGKCIASYLEVTMGAGFEKSISRWSGRIMPTLGKSDRMELLKSYFDRNHDYRQGNLKYEGALIYGPDPTLNACKQSNECFSEAKKHFVDETHITTEDKLNVIAAVSPEENTEATYLSKQKEPYKFELVNAHGGTTSFMSGREKTDTITYSELVDNKPGALFTIFQSCSVGSFNVKDNLATAHIFEGNGLAAYAASLPIFTLSPFEPNFNDLSFFIVGAGGRLHEAFSTRHYFNILGDPTIRINEPPKEGCKLAFNQTKVDLDIRLTQNGVENNDELGKHVKIKNIGSDTCYIRFNEVVSKGQGPAASFSFDKPKNKIDPGEIVEFKISSGLQSYTSDLWGADKTIRFSGLITFVTNDPQYLKSIPVQVTLIKV